MLYYHYCSNETFKNILHSKVLWLSNLTESNDKEEVRRTFKSLWNAIKPRLIKNDLNNGQLTSINEQIEIISSEFEIQPYLEHPFGICFCTSPDSDPHWSEYGSNFEGITLGFNFSWFEKLKQSYPHPSTIFPNAIGYNKIFYHNRIHENSLYKICYEKLIKQDNNLAWIDILFTFKHYSAFIKNPSFINEDETRIVYYPDDKHSNNKFKLTGPYYNPKEHYNLPWSKECSNALEHIVLGSKNTISIGEVKTLLKKNNIKKNIQISKIKK